jgi:protein SCO1/2
MRGLDFDPQIIPLTGTIDEISQVAKAFRVYYRRSSTLTDAKDDKKDKADANDDKTRTAKMETKPATDYLLDHSIFTYLMDKKGGFVQVFGKDSTPEGMAAAIREQLAKDLKN